MVVKFLNQLRKNGFSGSTHADYATRIVTATDGSIYQLIPQAVLYPKSETDIKLIFKLAATPPFAELTFSPRGGGTGANGQSLTPGITIDCSKYMTEISQLNLDEKTVRVQPGVVLDQLNAFLKPHGFFFAPPCFLR